MRKKAAMMAAAALCSAAVAQDYDSYSQESNQQRYQQSPASQGQQRDQNRSSSRSQYRAHEDAYQNQSPQQQRRQNRSQASNRLNKASSLVGAIARTRSNETIGSIKDVVIDVPSGRVVYVVVDASNMLGQRDALVAIPMRIIQTGRDQRSITVNADPQRLRSLQTFNSDSYPGMSQSRQASTYREQRQGQRGSQEEERNQNYYSSSQARTGQSSQGTMDDDTDWYYYEWYVLDPQMTSEQSTDFAGIYDPYLNQESSSSQGAYGQTEWGQSRFEQENSEDNGQNSQSRNFGQRYSEDSRYSADRYGERPEEYYYSDGNRSTRQESSQQYGETQSGQSRYGTRDRSYGYSDYEGGDHGDVSSSFLEQYSSEWDASGQTGPRGPQDVIDAQTRQPIQSSARSAAGSSGRYESESSSRSAQESNRSSQTSQGQEQRTFFGQIKDVNYSAQTLTVESDEQTLTFKLADQPRLRLNNRENARFNHFHEGQWVRVEFRYEDGANKAQSISETGYLAPNREDQD